MFLRNFIKKGLIEAIGKIPDYQIILNATGWYDKGVLYMEDLEEINYLIEEKNRKEQEEREKEQEQESELESEEETSDSTYYDEPIEDEYGIDVADNY